MRTIHLLTDTCSHGTGATFCRQGVLNIGTPQQHYIACSSKFNVVRKVQSGRLGYGKSCKAQTLGKSPLGISMNHDKS